MKKPIFEENFKIRYSEMDFDTVLKPSALLQFFQDLASENAESLDFGYSFNLEKNLAWFLLKYRIEFEDYPKGLYNIDIKTTPRGYNKIFAFRDFEVKHENKLLGRASSTWALVDINTKSMVNVEQALSGNPYMKQLEKMKSDLIYDKIRPLDRIDIEKTFEIRFDDLDVNRHVNNVNYVVWAFEPLEFDFRRTKKLKTLDIAYKKEVKYGAKILSQIELDGNTTLHAVKNLDTGDDLCLIKAKWVDK